MMAVYMGGSRIHLVVYLGAVEGCVANMFA